MNLSRISDLIEPIRERWIAAGATPRAGALPDDLGRFEVKHSVRLPADFAAFYRAVDGMPPNHMDDEMIRWWPIDEVKPVNDDLKAAVDAYRHQFIFADWSLWAHAYAIDLSPARSHGRIVRAGGPRPIPVARSFSQFPDLCVARFDKLHGMSGDEGAQ